MSKIDVSQWGEFRVGDLFEKISTKKVPFKALDLPQTPNSIQDLPLVAAGVDNQGRNRYVDPSCATVLSNCLTVSANGANSGAVFYQDSDFSILQDAYALQLVDVYKKHRVQNIYLFLASVLTNVLVNNDWINKATWRTVQDKEIYLPIISDDKPDWDYMDNYIAELAARAHKDVSSLNRVKSTRHQINISSWKGFKIGDLFDWFHGRRRNRNELELSPFDVRNNSVAYITAGFESQGIIGEVGLNYLANNQLETYVNAITIDMFGNCFFHNYKIAGDDNVYFLVNDERSINQMLFVSAVINSVTSSKFGYKNQFRQHNLLELQIKLPITSDGKPDWEYMDNYIAELASRTHRDITLMHFVTEM